MTRALARAALVAGLALATVGGAFAQSNVAKSIRYGVITSMEKTVVVDKAGSTGTVVGSTTGAVAGYALAESDNRWLGGLLGGAIGGAAGKGIDNAARKKKGWTYIIKLDETGEEIGIDIPGKKPKNEVGQHVRIMTGPDGKTKLSIVEA